MGGSPGGGTKEVSGSQMYKIPQTHRKVGMHTVQDLDGGREIN